MVFCLGSWYAFSFVKYSFVSSGSVVCFFLAYLLFSFLFAYLDKVYGPVYINFGPS
jgi:hypothetical protein